MLFAVLLISDYGINIYIRYTLKYIALDLRIILLKLGNQAFYLLTL